MERVNAERAAELSALRSGTAQRLLTALAQRLLTALACFVSSPLGGLSACARRVARVGP